MKMLSKDELVKLITKISHETVQKPKSTCQLLGMLSKNGEAALAYNLPSTIKKVTITEFYEAYKELNSSLSINHTWYTQTFPVYDSSSPCNFTTIGAVFVRLEFAEYKCNKYVQINKEI
ncbi:MAG: hypothetical protein J6N81_03350 [Treponema sp.]|nr:hypothetical protein [Treponema sp.]